MIFCKKCKAEFNSNSTRWRHEKNCQVIDTVFSIKKQVIEINNIKNELEEVIKTDFMPPGNHEKLTLLEKKLVYKWIKQGMKNTSCSETLTVNNNSANTDITFENSVKTILENTTDVVDIDWMVEGAQTEYKLEVDKEKSMLNGIAPQQIVGNLTYLLTEFPISYLYDENSFDEVNIVLGLNDADKTSLQDIQNIKIKGSTGNIVAVSDLVKVKVDSLRNNIYRKDQKRVVYVTADMAGDLESPVYAILGMTEKLQNIKLPKGYKNEKKFTFILLLFVLCNGKVSNKHCTACNPNCKHL